MENAKKPKISVIMGIYNCAETLPEALDSLLNQTFQDFEIILCNDGSSDNTYEVANEYKQKYIDKIVLIQNDGNKGLNFTLNHCLEHASGEYIARMDGDDISMPTRFEKEFNFLEEHKEYAIVSTPMIYFDENGDFRVGKADGEPPLTKFVHGTPFCHAPCMVRKEAYDAVDGYVVADNRLRVEDWDMWIRMYEKGYRGYMLNEPLYKMRDDQNAYSRRKFKFRVNEARVAASAVKKLHLPKKNYIFVLRPIIVGLLPKSVYQYLHKKNVSK